MPWFIGFVKEMNTCYTHDNSIMLKEIFLFKLFYQAWEYYVTFQTL